MKKFRVGDKVLDYDGSRAVIVRADLYGFQVGKEYIARETWKHVTDGWCIMRGAVMTLKEIIQEDGGPIRVRFVDVFGESFTVQAHNFARKFELKEDDKMGGELHGYPPEEESREVAVESEDTKRLREELAQTKKALQEQRNQDFGEVTQRHLWDVIVELPPKRFSYGRQEGLRNTEVVTETNSIAEAAMVAEAMAKGVSEDARVVKIVYQRVLGALK